MSSLKRKRVPEDDASSDSEGEEQTSDTPVLSHAQRRRQKKQAEKANKEDVTSKPNSKKQKLPNEKSSDSLPKRQNSVWIGNLLFRTTEHDIRKFFDGIGEISRIHMPMKAPTKPGAKPENRGFAYVDFTTPEAKDAAISRSEMPLNGRKLLIKDGGDFSGRPTEASNPTTPSQGTSKSAQKILSQQKQPPGPTLFLGNLSFSTTEDSIRRLFDGHRSKSEVEKEKAAKEKEVEDWIKRIRLGAFEDTGHCKGFAFVDFSSIANATSALTNLKNHHLDGRDIKLEYASADAVRRGASKQLLPATSAHGTSDKKNVKATQAGKAKYNKGARSKEVPEKHSRKIAEEEPTPTSPPLSEKPVEEHKEQHSRPQYSKKAGDNRHRPKPGAALAQAKRQSAAIVTTDVTVKKIKFS